MKAIYHRTMSCQVNQKNTQKPEGEGPYIDLKLEPHRVGELPESRDWPKFGEFLMHVNALPLFRTTGSKTCGQTPGGYDDAFVDIAFNESSISSSMEAHELLRLSFEHLSQVPLCPHVEIEVCASWVFLPDDSQIPSTRIWLKGERGAVDESFPVLIGFLAAQWPEMYKQSFGASG